MLKLATPRLTWQPSNVLYYGSDPPAITELHQDAHRTFQASSVAMERWFAQRRGQNRRVMELRMRAIDALLNGDHEDAG